jgi:TolB-like protein/Tfp pilus assembly protein PilF
MTTLRLKLFGGFELRDGDGNEIVVRNRKLQGLIAYLAAGPDRRHGRDALASLLWGDRLDAQARQSLRQALTAFRQLPGVDAAAALHADDDAVALDADAVSVDAVAFERLARDGEFERAAALYGGDFLAGLDMRSEPFDAWAADERGRLRDLACEVWEGLAERKLGDGDAEGAADAAKRAVTFDPLRESGQRLLMRAYVRAGRRSDALQQYQSFAALLRRELDAAPDPETTALYGQIRQAPGVAAETPRALPDKPSVAVLPLDNLSGDPEQAHFADGIAEDLITALSRIRWFFVIARSSSFSYKGRNADVRAVARDLGVRYIVGGSVRRTGGRIRLTAHLVDGVDGRQLWAERYDRDIADIFDLQDELTTTIVGAIEPKLGKAEQERALLKKPETYDLWDLYQQGMSALHRLTAESLPEAEAHFTRVTKADPDFAAAYAGLAEVGYYKLVLGFTDHPDATRAAALAAGLRAVACDREDSGAHCSLGRAYTLNRAFDDAIRELQAAVEINPSNALAHYGLGAAYVFSGRPEPSLTHLDDAVRLSPHDANMGSFCVRNAQAYLYLRDYEQAIDWARRSLQFANFQWSRYVVLISALGHLGRAEEARPAIDLLLRRIPDFSARYALDYSPWIVDAHFRHLMAGLEKAGMAV